MHDILILGAGKIGSLISGLLAESGDYRVQLADSKPGAADEVAAAHGLDQQAHEFQPERLQAGRYRSRQTNGTPRKWRLRYSPTCTK